MSLLESKPIYFISHMMTHFKSLKTQCLVFVELVSKWKDESKKVKEIGERKNKNQESKVQEKRDI